MIPFKSKSLVSDLAHKTIKVSRLFTFEGRRGSESLGARSILCLGDGRGVHHTMPQDWDGRIPHLNGEELVGEEDQRERKRTFVTLGEEVPLD